MTRRKEQSTIHILPRRQLHVFRYCSAVVRVCIKSLVRRKRREASSRTVLRAHPIIHSRSHRLVRTRQTRRVEVHSFDSAILLELCSARNQSKVGCTHFIFHIYATFTFQDAPFYLKWTVARGGSASTPDRKMRMIAKYDPVLDRWRAAGSDWAPIQSDIYLSQNVPTQLNSD